MALPHPADMVSSWIQYPAGRSGCETGLLIDRNEEDRPEMSRGNEASRRDTSRVCCDVRLRQAVMILRITRHSFIQILCPRPPVPGPSPILSLTISERHSVLQSR